MRNMLNLVQVETSEAGWMTIRLNRPDKHNAFDSVMARQIIDAVRTADSDDNVRVVLFIGTGNVFCSGGDIEWMRSCSDMDEQSRLGQASLVDELFLSVYQCQKPTVAAVQGFAFGGAIGIIACCDVVIVDREAVFATSEAQLGIVPACLAPYLTAKIGRSHALRMILEASEISAAEAQRIGLIHHVIDSDKRFKFEIDALIHKLCRPNSKAQATSKALVRGALSLEMQSGRRIAVETLARSWASEEGKEGMSAFLEKRTPSWQLENTKSSAD